ncbi:PAP2 family protein [Myxococcus hansupus]|uniref:PAP2 family protein n=1 Tax=Pseudomyxococcus hansupus TaxID=1297742 RepID=A0A0H4WTF3_9BACT|nr:phosphatase PAP2 family protein [Myxococcus hansupus]AKQ64595.1 PAP2 family protein [Myxococcus hansupus]
MRSGPYLHELLLGTFGVILTLALLFIAGPAAPESLQSLLALTAFAAGVGWLARKDGEAHAFRFRLMFAYVATFFLYAFVAKSVPALGLTPRDDLLLAADLRLVGTTPAAWLQRWSTPWVNEVFSASYLAFHGYLHLAMAWAVLGPRARAEPFFVQVFSAYAFGLVGYYVMPAVGPSLAAPELFTMPIEGGPITRLNAAVVAQGSSTYDLFPSLHTYITLVLLRHDRVHHPWRFRLMVPVAVAIIASTLMLRYHYAVDLLAALVWFALFSALMPWAMRIEREARDDRAARATKTPPAR